MLEVQDLTKVYGNRKVLDTIRFTMEDQGILGFLGPNGAGKSTTMNIIAGYTSSTGGRVTINGHEILEDPIGCKKQIGYLPEHPPLYPDMTAGAYISFMFDLKKIKLPKKAHVAEIGEAVGITDVWDRLIKNLSKGYQQRIGLAQAMLGNPPVLILDEPTVGLDPKQILEIRNLIRELGKTRAVIFSSHILQEIQAVCGRIIVINKGVLVADDTPDNLAGKTSKDRRLVLCVEGPPGRVTEELEGIPHMLKVEQTGVAEDDGVEYLLENEAGFDVRRDVFRSMAGAGWPILALRTRGMSLEDVFLRLTAGDSSAFAGLASGEAPAGTEDRGEVEERSVTEEQTDTEERP
ncbi:MAG: ABC transporter ATP-binding protein [Spirochaetaceae bacterium]|jgi:ABC-2 type transport system ATP-binding protein|nr:ABC transporter ATP-binding protein [Spirochaetaceae bacterium]